MADAPTVAAAAATPNPSATLQPFAVRVQADTGVDFITIMSPAGIRYTHPNPALIGQHYIGTIEQAQRGQTYTETYTGSLGPSVRTVVPVFGAGQRVRCAGRGRDHRRGDLGRAARTAAGRCSASPVRCCWSGRWAAG